MAPPLRDGVGGSRGEPSITQSTWLLLYAQQQQQQQRVFPEEEVLSYLVRLHVNQSTQLLT